MERKNNNARTKKKTEDSARLRKLLDDVSANDERIKKFRKSANAEKNKKRLEKEAAEKKAVEDAQAAKEAEAEAAKDAEEKAKAERELGKKAKEEAKKAVKKNRRVLRDSVKTANHFAEGKASDVVVANVNGDVDFVITVIDADETAALAAKLNGLTIAGDVKNIWSGEVKRLQEAGKLKDGQAKTLA
jgi:DnaJ family protein C protein 2